ncbi:DUF3867 domain-containing protein [Clostridium sp. LIBA-8841]|uniref:DUF3867 domain-containing protein n=1 Tax=Clostridium sp. LIBA-8841 TaxID=2987530 RepID=UPI002AC55D78|nr:DUF3867 domain-containing protein [Clostridium sp. LIBA-8841]MDZ5255040.1 DUF3867 domain-containing protein [Clostridium sp. LIBA-8841]
MSDRIVDFNELKNKARDKDIDNFESYIYDLYYSVAQGNMSMMDLSREITKYMNENNISQEKFLNIQTEMLKRYGFDMEDIEGQMKNLGIDMSNFGIQEGDYEGLRKTLSFQEKYKGKVKTSNVTTYFIKNEKNDIELILEKNKVLITSPKNIDLQDGELNEFLCSYKKTLPDDLLDIRICENVGQYNY